MKRSLTALLLVTLSGVAAASSVDNSGTTQVEDYQYSTPLHIAKVINITRGDYCGIGQREMTYVDPMGITHVLRYQAFGDACNNEN
ncbi:DUF2790 domain-containing protein [Pseudomonas sp. N3-W]|jgi:hypothetical protein|uniref:DUF2790 domain-containing protein n=1 Tax=Pseudomonas fungipugnans TaxID=3024217 RepID=A0ABT6QHZ0_9PSED|nr:MULTISPECIES: DUF2790 domain-containing protein [unclassified Pseudomonas]MDI2590512.1 DUF2790 domain-containing protein [Pseudomonas sp. 681]UWF51794.1 DUF2790 domain-containing protein [Pseudomonas sp. N3-W]